jgi:UDP-N-acetyl-D-galactosamine dehydrogenase
VGLPLAVEFAKKFPVKGFDIKQSRVDELNNAFDRTLETSTEDYRLF